jgi:hypothetical protein
MVTRLLPPSEWSRIKATGWDGLDGFAPEQVSVIVVEDDDGAIVGCWGATLVIHAGSIWIAPGHRGRAGVMRRLLRGMRDGARGLGTSTVVVSVVTDSLRKLAMRACGRKAPGAQYAIDLARY